MDRTMFNRRRRRKSPPELLVTCLTLLMVALTSACFISFSADAVDITTQRLENNTFDSFSTVNYPLSEFFTNITRTMQKMLQGQIPMARNMKDLNASIFITNNTFKAQSTLQFSTSPLDYASLLIWDEFVNAVPRSTVSYENVILIYIARNTFAPGVLSIVGPADGTAVLPPFVLFVVEWNSIWRQMSGATSLSFAGVIQISLTKFMRRSGIALRNNNITLTNAKNGAAVALSRVTFEDQARFLMSPNQNVSLNVLSTGYTAFVWTEDDVQILRGSVVSFCSQEAPQVWPVSRSARCVISHSTTSSYGFLSVWAHGPVTSTGAAVGTVTVSTDSSLFLGSIEITSASVASFYGAQILSSAIVVDVRSVVQVSSIDATVSFGSTTAIPHQQFFFYTTGSGARLDVLNQSHLYVSNNRYNGSYPNAMFYLPYFFYIAQTTPLCTFDGSSELHLVDNSLTFAVGSPGTLTPVLFYIRPPFTITGGSAFDLSRNSLIGTFVSSSSFAARPFTFQSDPLTVENRSRILVTANDYEVTQQSSGTVGFPLANPGCIVETLYTVTLQRQAVFQIIGNRYYAGGNSAGILVVKFFQMASASSLILNNNSYRTDWPVSNGNFPVVRIWSNSPPYKLVFFVDSLNDPNEPDDTRPVVKVGGNSFRVSKTNGANLFLMFESSLNDVVQFQTADGSALDYYYPVFQLGCNDYNGTLSSIVANNTVRPIAMTANWSRLVNTRTEDCLVCDVNIYCYAPNVLLPFSVPSVIPGGMPTCSCTCHRMTQAMLDNGGVNPVGAIPCSPPFADATDSFSITASNVSRSGTLRETRSGSRTMPSPSKGTPSISRIPTRSVSHPTLTVTRSLSPTRSPASRSFSESRIPTPSQDGTRSKLQLSPSSTVSWDPTDSHSLSGSVSTTRKTRTLSQQTWTQQATITVDPCFDAVFATTAEQMIYSIQWSGDLSFVSNESRTSLTIAHAKLSKESVSITVGLRYPQQFKLPSVLRGPFAPIVFLDNAGPSTVTGKVLNASFFSLLIPQVTYNRYLVRSFVINLSPVNFYCEGKAAQQGLQITLSVRPDAIAISTGTVSTVNDVASSLSVVSGNPSAAVAAARVSMLQNLISCDMDTTEDDGNSVTGFFYGPSEGQYFRGAVVGNILFFFGIAAVGLVIALVASVWGYIRKHVPVQRGFVLVCDAIHYPSVLVTPLAVVLQPTTTASMNLLVLRPRDGDWLIGCCGLSFVLILSCTVSYVLLVDFRCVLKKRDSARGRETLAERALFFLFDSEEHWVVEHQDKTGKRWKQRFLFFFADFRFRWFSLFDLWMQVGLGMVAGVNLSLKTVCNSQLSIIVIVYLIAFGATLLMAPALSRFLHWYLVIVNGLGLCGAVSTLGGATSGSPTAFSVSSIAALVISSVSMLKTLPDLLLLTVALPPLVRSLKKPFLKYEAAHLQKIETIEMEKALAVKALMLQEQQEADERELRRAQSTTVDLARQRALSGGEDEQRLPRTISSLTSNEVAMRELLLGLMDTPHFFVREIVHEMCREAMPLSASDIRPIVEEMVELAMKGGVIYIDCIRWLWTRAVPRAMVYVDMKEVVHGLVKDAVLQSERNRVGKFTLDDLIVEEPSVESFDLLRDTKTSKQQQQPVGDSSQYRMGMGLGKASGAGGLGFLQRNQMQYANANTAAAAAANASKGLNSSATRSGAARKRGVSEFLIGGGPKLGGLHSTTNPRAAVVAAGSSGGGAKAQAANKRPVVRGNGKGRAQSSSSSSSSGNSSSDDDLATSSATSASSDISL